MNAEFRPVFEKLKNVAAELHYRWGMYREVYAGDAEQFAVLNRNGSNFFYYVQHLMLDHVALSFSKLTDPNTQGRFENLSLKQIHVYASNAGDNELIGQLKVIFEELMKNCGKFRELRNKRIAHGDLDHAMETADDPLPGISREYVETALETLRRYLNTVEFYYFNRRTNYEYTVGPSSAGGSALIEALKRADRNA